MSASRSLPRPEPLPWPGAMYKMFPGWGSALKQPSIKTSWPWTARRSSTSLDVLIGTNTAELSPPSPVPPLSVEPPSKRHRFKGRASQPKKAASSPSRRRSLSRWRAMYRPSVRASWPEATSPRAAAARSAARALAVSWATKSSTVRKPARLAACAACRSRARVSGIEGYTSSMTSTRLVQRSISTSGTTTSGNASERFARIRAPLAASRR
mmetsp:Transcript_28049/g.62558  ORF Transcript_28049/g.62558 Transcript_28049/m.62558 type:complete len:211 (+) Transcript_28049:602-1234(+)